MIVKDTHTLKEIKQQPDLWMKVIELIEQQKENLNDFLGDVFDKESEVIFTGAGSSFFIGEMVAPFFQKDTGTSSRAVETTEIVTHPEFFINKNKITLLVSFARSGNSPESVAALNLANKVSPNVKHLIITCNKDGALAKIKGNNIYSVVLPEVVIGRNCRITKAIIEKGCLVPEGTIIGEDKAQDEKRFHVSSGGVVLVTPEMLGQQRHMVR